MLLDCVLFNQKIELSYVFFLLFDLHFNINHLLSLR
jgi:hypothetical protein